MVWGQLNEKAKILTSRSKWRWAFIPIATAAELRDSISRIWKQCYTCNTTAAQTPHVLRYLRGFGWPFLTRCTSHRLLNWLTSTHSRSIKSGPTCAWMLFCPKFGQEPLKAVCKYVMMRNMQELPVQKPKSRPRRRSRKRRLSRLFWKEISSLQVVQVLHGLK